MTWVPGVLTAAQMNTYVPQAWTPYTPALTGTTNPVIGNGTAVGRYIQFGDLVFFSAKITFGSTSTYGSGSWFISLPVTPVDHAIRANVLCLNSGVANYLGQTYGSASPLGLGVDVSTGGGVMASVATGTPFTWGTADALEVSGFYEAA